nr:uncharacterized protein LOC111423162 [Onthophagus taurus]
MDVKTRCSINTLTGSTSPLDPTTSSPTRNGPGIRGPRRITCRYLVPLLPGDKTTDVCQKAFVSAFVITTKRVRLQREKLISSMGLNKYSNGSGTKTVKNYNNNNVLMLCDSNSDSSSNESRFDEELRRFGRQFQTNNLCFKDGRRNGDDPFVPLGLIVPDSVTITPIMPTVIDHDADIAIVNNFFSNQLWKPEYLKSYS